MFYAISNYGNENVTEWAPAFAQTWRTTLDVQYGEQKGNTFFGVQSNFLRNQEKSMFAGPGGFNDPDMLLLGAVSDMTREEERTYLALWAFAKAPLILSGDIQFIGNVNDTDSIANMLLNSTMIQIN